MTDDTSSRARHDPLFQLLVEHPERLNKFVRAMLPREWLPLISDRPFELVHANFTGQEKLEQHRADLVVQGWDIHGEPFQVAFEHKSEADPETPEQTMGYSRRLRERQAKLRPQPAPALPRVIPVLFTHGKRWHPPYTIPADSPWFGSLLEMAWTIDLFVMLHLDLHEHSEVVRRIEDADPGLRMWVRALQLPAKPEPAEMDRFVDSLIADDPWYRAVLGYTHDKVGKNKIDESLERRRPQERRGMMETWGEEVQREIGPKVARETTQQILLRQIQRRFGPLSAAHRERIAAGTLEDLNAWVDSVLDADSASEVLRAGPERVNGVEV